MVASTSNKAGNSLQKFAICALLTATLVVLVGWFTGARLVFHGALIAVAAAALLPFVVVAAIAVIPVVIAILLALSGMFLAALLSWGVADSGLPGWLALERGGWLIPRYYRFLAGQKHPLFWGVPAGLLLGAAALAVLIAMFIVPGESKTVRILVQTQAAIEHLYDSTGYYPRPDEDGYLPWAPLASVDHNGQTQGVVLDGFGRPVQYELRGTWKIASYRLRSYGFDSRPGRDDLVLTGSTELGRLADTTTALLRALRGEEGSARATLKEKLRGILSMQREADD